MSLLSGYLLHLYQTLLPFLSQHHGVNSAKILTQNTKRRKYTSGSI